MDEVIVNGDATSINARLGEMIVLNYTRPREGGVISYREVMEVPPGLFFFALLTAFENLLTQQISENIFRQMQGFATAILNTSLVSDHERQVLLDTFKEDLNNFKDNLVKMFKSYYWDYNCGLKEKFAPLAHKKIIYGMACILEIPDVEESEKRDWISAFFLEYSPQYLSILHEIQSVIKRELYHEYIYPLTSSGDRTEKTKLKRNELSTQASKLIKDQIKFYTYLTSSKILSIVQDNNNNKLSKFLKKNYQKNRPTLIQLSDKLQECLERAYLSNLETLHKQGFIGYTDKQYCSKPRNRPDHIRETTAWERYNLTHGEELPIYFVTHPDKGKDTFFKLSKKFNKNVNSAIKKPLQIFLKQFENLVKKAKISSTAPLEFEKILVEAGYANRLERKMIDDGLCTKEDWSGKYKHFFNHFFCGGNSRDVQDTIKVNQNNNNQSAPTNSNLPAENLSPLFDEDLPTSDNNDEYNLSQTDSTADTDLSGRSTQLSF